MGSRLWSMRPNEAIKLMHAWGWVDEGPVPGHGTQSAWRWQDDGRLVQVPNRGVKKYERAIQSAFDKAWRVMGLNSLQEFLDGPPDREKQPLELIDGLDPEALRRAERLREQHEAAAEKEQVMTEIKVGPGIPSGLTPAIERAIRSIPKETWTPEEIREHLRATGFPEEALQHVGSNMAQISKRKSDKLIVRVGRGVYRPYSAIKPAEAPIERTVDPTPVSSQDETKRELGLGHVLAEKPQPVAAASVVSNGSTPELLSRVAVLDGGSLLFQGDDGSLYVVKQLVKLALPQ